MTDGLVLHLGRSLYRCFRKNYEKRLISFVKPVCLSVRTEQFASHWTDFREISHLGIFRKSSDKFQVSLKSDNNNRQAHYMKTDIHLWSHLVRLYLECQMFRTKVVQKIKTHIFLCSVNFSQNSCHLWDNVELCGTARLATDENMAHALCIHHN
jgi:hypothetical protein